MLEQFNFKNFKSFKEEVSLDLTATKISEYPDHVVKFGNEKILRVAAIYGANASGKSNIYDAFKFMSYYVSDSFKFGGESNNKSRNDNDDDTSLKITPFLFDEKSKDEKSTFEVFFIDAADKCQRVYQYGFAINKDEILEEWLFSKAKSSKEYKTIFYRIKGQKLQFDGIGKRSAENIEVALEKETLIVSLGAKLKVAKLKFVRDWFEGNGVVDFGNPAENFFRSRLLPNNFVYDKEVQKKVIDYISTFDETIQDFNVEKVESDDDKDGHSSYTIDAVHKMIDSEKFNSIPLRDESSGTLKMFALFPSIQDVLESGNILFVDELNARLHPLLVRNIILTFINPEINKNNAQLVFTTHDVWQLSNELLRRDEILFVEKDKDGVSSLYSLVDFIDDSGNKIRKDETFLKNYLSGKYGAIPKLKSIQMFKEE